MQANEAISSYLKKLQTGELTEDKTLEEILMLRYSFIDSRRKNSLIFHKNFINNPSGRGDILYGPTDPNIYDLLTPEQQILSIKAIDKYQTFNRIILGIASMIDLRTLPANTKRLLRASPTLCSLLEDSSKGFGHPDETFILKAAYKGQMSDYEYFTTHLRYTEQVTLTYYSSFHKQEKTTTVPPHEKKFLEPTWQHPYALSELPYPKFLKPYPLERSKRAPFVTSSSSGYTPLSIEVSLSGPLVDVHKPADLPLSPEIPEEGSLPVAKSSMTLPSFSIVEEPVSTILEEQERDNPTAPSSSTPPLKELQFEITQSEESQTPDLAPPRPRGMRSFHAKIPEATPLNHFVSLKGKHQRILDRLFDVTRFSSVRYQDFAALWRSINGPDSIKNASSGGSHKALLDQNGKVITGIFAHGESQTFGKRTIKYVRDAFHQIGYGPTR
ncbi:hypothetical protein QM565_22720 [Geitlerinema splendidum]|nr:hypothetical protein [Geitlerinema splendidum]